MDLDLLLYIVFIVGSIVFSVFKKLKTDEAERTAKKNRQGPIAVETVAAPETQSPRTRKSKKKAAPQPPQPSENEYFSYETMSERDFAQEFGQAGEETFAADVDSPQPAVHLAKDAESVFNGVVWSEILNRKY